MVIPSFVTYEGRARFDHNIFHFAVWNIDGLDDVYIEKCEDGIITIMPPGGTNIKVFADFVSGIFHPKSKFAAFVCEELKVPPEDFVGVRFDFNDVIMTVTKENSDPKLIYKTWYKEMKKRRWK